MLGFERELSARVRAESAGDGALPFAETIALAVPRDVRVAQIAIDYGVISDVFAGEAVARALGLALTAPALPARVALADRRDDRGRVRRARGCSCGASARISSACIT